VTPAPLVTPCAGEPSPQLMLPVPVMNAGVAVAVTVEPAGTGDGRVTLICAPTESHVGGGATGSAGIVTVAVFGQVAVPETTVSVTVKVCAVSFWMYGCVSTTPLVTPCDGEPSPQLMVPIPDLNCGVAVAVIDVSAVCLMRFPPNGAGSVTVSCGNT